MGWRAYIFSIFQIDLGDEQTTYELVILGQDTHAWMLHTLDELSPHLIRTN